MSFCAVFLSSLSSIVSSGYLVFWSQDTRHVSWARQKLSSIVPSVAFCWVNYKNLQGSARFKEEKPGHHLSMEKCQGHIVAEQMGWSDVLENAVAHSCLLNRQEGSLATINYFPSMFCGGLTLTPYIKLVSYQLIFGYSSSPGGLWKRSFSLSCLLPHVPGRIVPTPNLRSPRTLECHHICK